MHRRRTATETSLTDRGNVARGLTAPMGSSPYSAMYFERG